MFISFDALPASCSYVVLYVELILKWLKISYS